MRVAIFTSNHLRHRYFARRLAERFEVTTIFWEEKSFDPRAVYRSPEEAEVLREWFGLRDQAELEFFGDEASLGLPHIRSYDVGAGKINQDDIVRLVHSLKPDVAAVFGSGILRKPLLEAIAGRAVNLHLGLSPYYRGSGTNFWPFVNNEPHLVGATIHWLDLGVDSGPIIAQDRPAFEPRDNPHTIGCKVIVRGTSLMQSVLTSIEGGKWPPGVQQDLSRGRVYLRKEFSAEHAATVLRKWRSGVIARYAMAPVEVPLHGIREFDMHV